MKINAAVVLKRSWLDCLNIVCLYGLLTRPSRFPQFYTSNVLNGLQDRARRDSHERADLG